MGKGSYIVAWFGYVSNGIIVTVDKVKLVIVVRDVRKVFYTTSQVDLLPMQSSPFKHIHRHILPLNL
jgi:hypothetical protein